MQSNVIRFPKDVINPANSSHLTLLTEKAKRGEVVLKFRRPGYVQVLTSKHGPPVFDDFPKDAA